MCVEQLTQLLDNNILCGFHSQSDSELLSWIRGFLMLMLCTVSNSGPKCFPVLWWRDIFTGCSHLNIICIKTSGYKHTVCILVSTAEILHHIFNETCIKSFRFSAHFSFSFFSKICLLSNSHACMTMGFTASDSCCFCTFTSQALLFF